MCCPVLKSTKRHATRTSCELRRLFCWEKPQTKHHSPPLIPSLSTSIVNCSFPRGEGKLFPYPSIFYLNWCGPVFFFHVLSLLLNKFWCGGGLGAVDHVLLCWAESLRQQKNILLKSVKMYSISRFKPQTSRLLFFSALVEQFSTASLVIALACFRFEKKGL